MLRALHNLQGLYFRKIDEQIILRKCNSIHTLFFRQDIDVAFVSKDNIVLKSIRNLAP